MPRSLAPKEGEQELCAKGKEKTDEGSSVLFMFYDKKKGERE